MVLNNLSPKKQKAVTALIEQPSIPKAAKAVGVGTATIYRWLADHDFSRVFRAARHKVVAHTISRIQQASSKAVDALIEILESKDSPPSTRVSAARTVLEMTTKSLEIEDLQARIDAIEDILNK